MSVQTNARTPNQQRLVQAFTERFEDPDVEINFDGLKVQVADTQTGEVENFGNYAAFKSHIENGASDGASDGASAEGEGDSSMEEFEAAAAEAATQEAADAEAAVTGDDEDEFGFMDDEGDEDEIDFDAAEEDEIAAAIEAAMRDESGAEAQQEAEQEDAAPEAEEAAQQAAEATQQSEEQGQQERDKRAESELDRLIADMTETVLQERRGEIAKNEARWHKGEQVARVDDIAARYKQAGRDDLASRSKLMDYATNAVEETVRSQGIIEGISRLNSTELAFTKKAYTTFAQHYGGPTGTFRLLDQLDEMGHPLEDEDGNPYVKQIGEIALNKAYHLADYMTTANRDRLLSFAWGYSEATCRGLFNLLKERNAQQYPERVDDILDAFYENTVEVQDDSGAFVKINMPDADARDFLRQRGAKVQPQVKSIKVDAALYEGMWSDVVEHASVIWKWLGNETHPETGYMRNTVLLERLLAFFSPSEYGFSNLVQMLVESGDMTKAQATQFLEEHTDWVPEEK